MPKKNEAAKPATKKSQVETMLRESSASVQQIADKLSISKQAAYSLIGDVKRSGVAISGALKDGVMHYSVDVPKKPKAKAARTFGKGATVSADVA
ncbi:hypothetical protein RFM23_09450 [Mesorhizobium abyssinicae]|uniref:HTH domain-containing protein n=1 Tax=Mesorhizobium abyssinicae TaxID=1209958 RepID=A0ABU5AKQ6_9HYPH|nr:HTH domain-containing protein [Mesorhizobium abyssinicae]MDX8537846.1 hypothetical protein [Mesorhizobium abyssinicae]